MIANPLLHVGVVGAGAMGSGIAQVAAQAGHRVILSDASAVQVARAKASIEKNFKRDIEKGKLDQGKANATMSRISFVENSQAVALSEMKECGLVIEAIVENQVAKKTLFADLEGVVSKRCILATNTSSLSVTSIASNCKLAERVIGIHFFNPAQVMPLVEIVPGIGTDAEFLEIGRTLIDSWGKTTVLAKDTPGFIVNRIARPFYGEAIRIFEEGIADFATIDWAMKELGGFRMGPFELMDFIGNDINLKVTESVFEAFFYDPRYRPSITQRRVVEANRFGRKSGIGYYDYRPDAKFPEPRKDTALGQEIFGRVLTMLINEAIDALFWQVATVADIDLAMTKGVNYPRGLLDWADELGPKTVLESMERLRSEYGEDRYRPSPLLRKMAAEGKKFCR